MMVANGVTCSGESSHYGWGARGRAHSGYQLGGSGENSHVTSSWDLEGVGTVLRAVGQGQ
eukprot:2605804-Rhodomonas_salina.2